MLRVAALLRIAVACETGGEPPELRAPIAHIGDPADVPSARASDASDRRADHRGANVVERKRLGDVGAGEVVFFFKQKTAYDFVQRCAMRAIAGEGRFRDLLAADAELAALLP